MVPPFVAKTIRFVIHARPPARKEARIPPKARQKISRLGGGFNCCTATFVLDVSLAKPNS